MNEWIQQGLMDWDISRDAPYFGFEIPEAPGKYFYVWLDAPIGYLASFQNLCAKLGLNFDDWFKKDSTAELYHFIGKDILYFHALFWPAVLASIDFRTPDGVFAHGFLTIDGKKMSKSRGTFITAKSYLDQGLNPEWMRYYMAAKLNAHVEDIDLSFNDFVLRVNSDLIGKFINIASRTAKLLQQNFHNQLASKITSMALLGALQNQAENIANAYENREYSQAIRKIMALADQVNLYISTCQPWLLVKDSTQHTKLHEICTILINAFRILSIYLKPVLPKSIAEIESFLNCQALTWQDVNNLLPSEHIINPYQHLMQRVDFSELEQLIKVN
jgi:methionyl-tRNA synthetase